MFAEPEPVDSLLPALAALERKIHAAARQMGDLKQVQGELASAVQAADARGKLWSDLAYEMWALLARSRHDGAGPADAGIRWQNTRDDLRTRIYAALNQDGPSPEVKP